MKQECQHRVRAGLLPCAVSACIMHAHADARLVDMLSIGNNG